MLYNVKVIKLLRTKGGKMMKYRLRKAWRHFKYRLLELFFGKVGLKKLIDIDRLDFEDAVKLTSIRSDKWLTKEEHEFFNSKDGEKYNLKYGLQYALARDMAEILAKHVDVMEVFDTDENKYLCVGEITLIERK